MTERQHDDKLDNMNHKVQRCTPSKPQHNSHVDDSDSSDEEVENWDNSSTHTVKLSAIQKELIHFLHMCLNDIDHSRTCIEMMLTLEGFYKSENIRCVHFRKESPVLLEEKKKWKQEMPEAIFPDAQDLICEYIMQGSDEMILDAAIKVFQWKNMKETHWLFKKAKAKGVWYVIRHFANRSIYCDSHNEYVELVLQFLLHHKSDGLYDILLAIKMSYRNAFLVIEAINQAWEMEHWKPSAACHTNKANKLLTKSWDLEERDCDCSICKLDYCHRSSVRCLCQNRRRVHAQMQKHAVCTK